MKKIFKCLKVFITNESKLDELSRREAVGGRPRLAPPLPICYIQNIIISTTILLLSTK